MTKSLVQRSSALMFFRWPILATLVVFALSYNYAGWPFLLTVAILGIVEFVLSFDNALVNAKILERMSPFWQRMFLSIGILVAVFGMRLLFPLLVVMFTAGLSMGQVWDLALNHPHQYEQELHEAHPAIVGFGGIFLLMLFLTWIFERRDIHWLGSIERWLAKLGKRAIVADIIGITVLYVVSVWFSGGHTTEMLTAGIAGWILFRLVQLVDEITAEKTDEQIERSNKLGIKEATGLAGFALFMKLELIDASFSFDGVAGAFAITTNIVAIMAGLGIGAFFVRSLTVYLTRKGTLSEYRYLEHGAYWAIGFLAFTMFFTVERTVPEWFTGTVSIIIIGSAFASSIRHNAKLTAKHNP